MMLFRRYRPRRFSDVVGQPFVARALRSAVQHDRLAACYLFTGPRGTGKTSAARILARAIGCAARSQANWDGEPCLTCAHCEAVEAGVSPDVLEIDAASNRSIDDVRSLREQLLIAPMQSPRRVIILDEAHMLTSEAFNALLKMLEEPPEHVLFVLATTELQRLPGTVQSRCTTLPFRRIGIDAMAERLERIAALEGIILSGSGVKSIARHANGSLRDALVVLEQTAVLAATEEIQATLVEAALGLAGEARIGEIVLALADGDTSRALLSVDELLGRGTEPRALAVEVAEHAARLLREPQTDEPSWYPEARGRIAPSVRAAILDAFVEASTGGGILGSLAVERAVVRLSVGATPISSTNASTPRPASLPVPHAASASSMADRLPKREPQAAPANASAPPAKLPSGDDLPPLTLDQIKQGWRAAHAELTKKRHDIGDAWLLWRPVQLNGPRLQVETPMPWHVSWLKVGETSRVIEDALQRQFGVPLQLVLSYRVAATENRVEVPASATVQPVQPPPVSRKTPGWRNGTLEELGEHTMLVRRVLNFFAADLESVQLREEGVGGG